MRFYESLREREVAGLRIVVQMQNILQLKNPQKALYFAKIVKMAFILLKKTALEHDYNYCHFNGKFTKLLPRSYIHLWLLFNKATKKIAFFTLVPSENVLPSSINTVLSTTTALTNLSCVGYIKQVKRAERCLRWHDNKPPSQRVPRCVLE